MPIETPFSRSQVTAEHGTTSTGDSTISSIDGLTEALAALATKAALSSVEMTITSLATSQSVTELEAGINLLLGDKADKSVVDVIGGDVSALQLSMQNFMLTTDINALLGTKVDNSTLSSYVTKTALDSALLAVNNAIQGIDDAVTGNITDIGALQGKVTTLISDVLTKVDKTAYDTTVAAIYDVIATTLDVGVIANYVLNTDFTTAIDALQQDKASVDSVDAIVANIAIIEAEFSNYVLTTVFTNTIATLVTLDTYNAEVASIISTLGTKALQSDLDLLETLVTTKASVSSVDAVILDLQTVSSLVALNATKAALDTLSVTVSNIESGKADKTALLPFLTETAIDALLADKLDISAFNTAIANYVTTTELSALANVVATKLEASDIVEFVTDTEITNKIANAISPLVNSTALATTLADYVTNTVLSDTTTALNASIDGKAPIVHEHEIVEVTGLEAALLAITDDITLLSQTTDSVIVSHVTIHEENIQVTVGVGGDYETLNEALAFLHSQRPAYSLGGAYMAVVMLLPGFVLRETIVVADVDASWITISGSDPIHYIDESYITENLIYDDRIRRTHTAPNDSTFVYAAFLGIRCSMPRLNVKFRCINGTVGWGIAITITGYLLTGGAIGQVEAGKGITHCSGSAFSVIGGATLYAHSLVATNSLYGITAEGSDVYVEKGNFDDSYYTGIAASAGAQVHAEEATSRRATLYYGILSAHGATINAYSMNCRRRDNKDSKEDIGVQEGGCVVANKATGGLSERANRPGKNGVIWR